MKNAKKGYSLSNGPFAKWRHPMNRVLYKKRLAAGPEPERHRSAWHNWNYNTEIYAFSKRINEEFNDSLLRQAFIHPDYNIGRKAEFEEVDVKIEEEFTSNNFELAINGESICFHYLKSVFKFWYPNLPEEGTDQIIDFLMSTQTLAHIAQNIGIKDLIKCKEFPISPETLQATLFALIGALKASAGTIRAHLFINDFILTHLIGKNINELWTIKDPMGQLIEELEKKGIKSKPESRCGSLF
jgi:large subunit ribosomal protein L44